MSKPSPKGTKVLPPDKLLHMADRIVGDLLGELAEHGGLLDQICEFDGYDRFLASAGVDFHTEPQYDLKPLLPSDEARKAFERYEKFRNEQQLAREEAAYALGVAMGRRLAGGAR